MRSTSDKFDVFNSRDDIYLVFNAKSQFSFYFIHFLEDLRLINEPCFKKNHSHIKEDKGVFVTKYLDQSKVIGT